MKNILFVASECVPFMKTGGLADVVGALPTALDKSKYDVRVILPNYTAIPWEYRGKFQHETHFYMDLGFMGDAYVGIRRYEEAGITYYFIDNKYYFRGDRPYGDPLWDIEKFCYFSKAVLAVLPVLDFRPDVIHCHDWQTALVPVFLHTLFRPNPFFSNIRTVMTIHNLHFQGVWDIPTLERFTALPPDTFTADRMEFYGNANMLKGGMVYADRITTVSRSYAEEIQAPYYGEGLDGLLRARNNVLSGIVNGIDTALYNPATAPFIPQQYCIDTFREGKAAAKLQLQRELDLPERSDCMLVAIISRLTDQKGLDLVAEVIDRMLDAPIQLAVIGTGDPVYEALFRSYAHERDNQVSATIRFVEDLAHVHYAAADAILMPSRFEPCGLTQMIGMRYGALPIVRETGGLNDTVEAYNEYTQTGTGFSFAHYNAEEMLHTVQYAEHVFFDDRAAWEDMVRRAMQQDFSWSISAPQYEALYDALLAPDSACCS